MKLGFCSRVVHIFEGSRSQRVPAKSGFFLLGFFWLNLVFFVSPGLVLPKSVLEREENEECLAQFARLCLLKGGKRRMSRTIRSFVFLER